MEISKEIQVQYLEKVTQHIRIGYLFGKGTFSGEVISKNFRGVHIYYDTYELLKSALENKAVDYILIPTYNSLIGEIIKPETYWDVHGTVDHRIDLSLYSNTKLELSKTRKYEPDVLYLETHVQKEAENYLYKYFSKKTEVIIVNTSKTGCINCIKDIGKRVSMTISSKNNNSNFLTLIDSDIVNHNITTFSLIGI
jgi:prephenate dehydratase